MAHGSRVAGLTLRKKTKIAFLGYVIRYFKKHLSNGLQKDGCTDGTTVMDFWLFAWKGRETSWK